MSPWINNHSLWGNGMAWSSNSSTNNNCTWRMLFCCKFGNGTLPRDIPLLCCSYTNKAWGGRPDAERWFWVDISKINKCKLPDQYLIFKWLL